MHRHRVAIAMAALAELGWVSWWVSGGPVTVLVALQAWMVIVGAVVLVVWRHLRLQSRYRERLGHHAAATERARIAADLHDLLGHDLALLATQASRLEMTSTEDPARQAASIRERTATATDRLHEVVRLLDQSDADSPASSSETVAEVVDAARQAGMTVEATLDDLADVDAVIGLALTGLSREALTNAARHAHGRAVALTVSSSDHVVRLTVENRWQHRVVQGSGLRRWARRVEVLGGRLRIYAGDEVFRLQAELPARARLQDSIDTSGHQLPTPPWSTSLVAPLGLLVVLVVGGWAAASTGRTLSAEDFGALEVGQPTSVARAFLPSRPALIDTTGVERPGCRTYTDAAFPVPQGVFVVCQAGGRITALEDRR